MSPMALAYFGALGVLAAYGLHRLSLIVEFWRRSDMRVQPDSPARLPDEFPVVTVQLPLFNELNVAARLIDTVAQLSWPMDKLQIQLLDDSTDETRELCREKCASLRRAGFDVQHLHRSERTGFKAGALEAGAMRARGELLLVLDADFLPPADLLERTVGYFGDASVGMVQVRWEHINRDFSELTRVQALLLDGHFVVEQSVRHRTRRFFNFNGTAGLWRREAIIDAGGWQHDTLTEDLDLSYRALLAGWRFEYLLGVAAPAELPVQMSGFKSQQFRWAKGSVQVARKLLPRVLRANLPMRVKLEAFFHLTQNVPYLVTLCLAMLTVPVRVLAPADSPIALDVMLLLGTGGVLAAYCATSQWALGRARVLRMLILLPSLVAVTVGISVSQSRAVIEGALGHQSEFVRTPKHGLVRKGGGRRWARRRYRGTRDLIVLAEVALALYFAVALVIAVRQGIWTTVPVVALFAAGFCYVGASSIRAA